MKIQLHLSFNSKNILNKILKYLEIQLKFILKNKGMFLAPFFLFNQIFAETNFSDTLKLKKIEIKANRYKKIYGSKRKSNNVFCSLRFPTENDGFRSVGIKIKNKKYAVKKLIKVHFYLGNDSLFVETLNISSLHNFEIDCLYSKSNLKFKKGWNTLDLSEEKIFIEYDNSLMLRFKSKVDEILLMGSLIPKGNILYNSEKKEFYEFKFASAAFFLETLEWN